MHKERSRLYVGVVALLLGLWSRLADGQTVETGFLNRVVSVDGVEFRYQVYVPESFQRSTSWPVILALHGGPE
jgi:poly(3-hydroxybutyrate) depolymerase